LDDPETDVKDVAKFIKGADFPTGGMIAASRASGLPTHCRGSLKMRGRIGIEEVKGGKNA